MSDCTRGAEFTAKVQEMNNDPSMSTMPLRGRWRDVPRVMQTKFPATVMVFGVVSSEGYDIPPKCSSEA
ncbi:hypothetical protein FHG87_013041 [Trinorchestia longiramus]|nr:hypothetical protein FHG87_013041 [Trinorchestia longiramus]